MNKKIAIAIVIVFALVLAVILAACQEGLPLPEYVTPTVSATYGQTLGELTLPEGFAWQDDATTTVGEVGSHVFLVTYTPSDPEKYRTVKDVEVTVTVGKGTPTPDVVVTLSATYGDTLSSVALPAGFSWEEEGTTSVGNVGEHVFHVRFTPADTANFESVTGIPVTVRVAKATYDMTAVTFTNKSVVYNGEAQSLLISGALPAGVTVSYERNVLTNAGSTNAVAHFAGDDECYEAIPDMTATLTVEKANALGIVFASETVPYDGETHTLTASSLPEGVSVSYENNSGSAVGTYEAIARFTVNDNFNPIADMTATLRITKAVYDMAGVTFASATYTYDGSEKTVLVSGTLPKGVTVRYENNVLTNAGSTTAVAHFTGDDECYEAIPDMRAVLAVDKATYDMTGVTFAGATYTYDGTEKVLLISGTLPEGVAVSYENNVLTNAGSTNAVAHFAGDADNYNAISDMTAVLTVNKATYDMSGVTFNDRTITYGESGYMEIEGTLPDGVSVSYENNDNMDAGTYIVTAHFAGDSANYNVIPDMTATLTINKAAAWYVTGIDSFTYDGQAHSFVPFRASGEVTYTGTNSFVHAGTHTVSLTIAGNKNYYEASYTAELTITKAPLSISVNDLTVSYGDTPDYTVSYATFCGSDDSSVLGGELHFTSDYTVGSPIGTYEVTVGGLTSNDYDIGFVAGTLTVEKKEVRIVAHDKTIAYGDALPELTYTATGFVGNDTPASVIPNFKIKCSSYEVGKTPGYYQISVIAPNTIATPNYHITTVDGFLHVVKAAAGVSITSTTEGMSVDFGNEVPDVTYTKVSTSDAVTVEYKAADADDEAYTTVKPTDAGSYLVRVSVATNDLYEAGAATLAFTINKVEDPEADSVEAPSQRTATYGDLLSSVELPEGWFWVEEEGTLVGDATEPDTRAFRAKYVQTNYADVIRDVEVRVNKADWEAPAEIIYVDYYPGKMLKSVSLPDHWYWYTNPNTTELPTPSSQSSSLPVLASTDGDANHNSHLGVYVYVSMRKGTPQVTINKDLSKDYDGNPVVSTNFSSADFSISPSYSSANIFLKFKKADEPDSKYGNTAPTEPGQYVCKLTLTGTEWYNEAYATKEFEIRRLTASTHELWFDRSEYACFVGDWNEYSRPTYVMPYRLSGVGCEDDITIYHKPQGSDDSLYTTDLPIQVGVYDVKAVLENAHYLPFAVYCTLTLTGGVPIFVYQDTANDVTYSFNAKSVDEDPTICLLYDGIYSLSELSSQEIAGTYYLEYDWNFENVLWVSPDEYDFENRIYFDYDKEAGTIAPFSIGEVRYLAYKAVFLRGNSRYSTLVFSIKDDVRTVFLFEDEYRSVDEIPDTDWEFIGTWTQTGNKVTFISLNEDDSYFETSEDPKEIVLRVDYGELFALITVTFTPEPKLRGKAPEAPITETYAFFKQHGKRNCYIFMGEVTLADIKAGAECENSTPLAWYYEEDAEILAIGYYSSWEGSYDWRYAFRLDGDEWTPIGDNGEWSFLGDDVTVNYYAYFHWLDENEDWHTATYLFISIDDAKTYFYFEREGLTPLSYSDIIAILTDNASVAYEDYFIGGRWAYDDDNQLYSAESGSPLFYLDRYGIEATPVGDWMHLLLNGEDYFLYAQTPSGGHAQVFDDTKYTAKQLAHTDLETLYSTGILDLHDYEDWVWHGRFSTTFTFDPWNKQIVCILDGHEATLFVGTPLYIYHDVKGNATYSFNAEEADDKISRCFVYEGIHEMEELESLTPIAFYFASRAQSTVVWISENNDPDEDEMVVFDLDPNTGVVGPHDLGEVRYLAYMSKIEDVDENDMPITQIYTYSFNFVEDCYYVFSYKGRYDSADDLPIVGYWIGEWEQNGDKIIYFSRYGDDVHFKTNENSIVLSVDYGELFALITLSEGSITETVALFTQDGERTVYMFTEPVTEESIYEVPAVLAPISWFYDEDAKMIAWNAFGRRQYVLYLDGDEWKTIQDETEVVRYYTYEYRLDEEGAWHTTTYLFTTVYNENENNLYAFEREGKVAPLTYVEIVALLAKENPTEDDYVLIPNGWSRSADTISINDGPVFAFDSEGIYVSYYSNWAFYTNPIATFLFAPDNRVYSIDDDSFTPTQVLHINPDLAIEEGILRVGLVEWGFADVFKTIAYLGESPYQSNFFFVFDPIKHTFTLLGEGEEPWCIGYFVMDDDAFETPITYTLVFYAYTKEFGVVYSAQGEYDWDTLDQADLARFACYQPFLSGNAYYVFSEDFEELYEVNGNVATLSESNFIS